MAITERTKDEMLEALHRMCQAAWNPAASVPIFSIPARPQDADMILADVIAEVLARRAGRWPIEEPSPCR